MKKLTNELKVYELSCIYKDAEYNFAFWDKIQKTIDWKKEYEIALKRVLKTKNIFEYYLELKRFICKLKDGHTDVSFPNKIESMAKYTSKLPIHLIYIHHKIYVLNVKECVKDKIKRFSIVKKINGIETFKYLKKNIFPYAWHEKLDSGMGEVLYLLNIGPKNSKVSFTFFKDGKEYTQTLTRTKNDTSWVYNNVNFNLKEKLQLCYSSDSHSIYFTKDSIAIIQIDTFDNNDLPQEIFKNYELLATAKGYIIDIRNNGGGNSCNGDALASLFIGNKFTTNRFLIPIYKGIHKAHAKFSIPDGFSYDDYVKLEKEDNKEMYDMYFHQLYENKIEDTTICDLPGLLKGPIIVLSSQYSASAAEDFLMVMRKHTNAIIMGSASYGSTGQPLYENLLSGGSYRICTIHSLTLDNEEFINKGIVPDIKCSLSIKDFENEYNSVMNKALNEIRKKLN